MTPERAGGFEMPLPDFDGRPLNTPRRLDDSSVGQDLMRTLLEFRRGLRVYALVEPSSAAMPGSHTHLAPRPAVALLSQQLARGGALRSLRRAPRFCKYDDEQLLARVLLADLRRSRLRLYQRELVCGSHEPPATTEEEDVATQLDHWIELCVVLDGSGQAIAGARLRLLTPSGEAKLLVTGASGSCVTRGLDAGTCSLRSSVAPTNARLGEAWHVVGIGPATLESNFEQVPVEARGGELLTIEMHAVSDGESLASLAAEHSMKAEELARFNWGPHASAERQVLLRDRVGCRTRDEAGDYVFSDADEPGLLAIPSEWSESGLATDSKHVIRVRRELPPIFTDWSFSI